MSDDLRSHLGDWLLGLADDELVLAHRNSEWTGHAPIVEEDIAFTNLALDELGHANLWYGLHASLVNQDSESYPDHLVFFREAPFFRNVQMVELPKGDWAFSVLRQYLFDAAEAVWLPRLSESAFAPLAEAAGKVAREEQYHLQHTQAWVMRLGLGTEESHRRMQAALEALWPYALQLFQSAPEEAQLAEAGWAPQRGELEAAWKSEVGRCLAEAELTIPELARPKVSSRLDHTESLVALLSEMQRVARAYPGVSW
jgi:ring-1,2-phenylacetyl-CoA epoxidase subunit PaaC